MSMAARTWAEISLSPEGPKYRPASEISTASRPSWTASRRGMRGSNGGMRLFSSKFLSHQAMTIFLPIFQDKN
jgi:hypothetical protein